MIGSSITETTCKIRNAEFHHSMEHSDARAAVWKIKAAIKNVDSWKADLSKAVDAQDSEAIDHLSDLLLMSPDAALAACTHQAINCNGVRPTLERVLSCAAKTDLTKPLNSLAKVWVQAKSSGHGWRAITSFGLKHQTAQQMVQTKLGAHHRPRPFQTSCSSLPEGMKAIRASVAKGHAFAAHMDISRFYPSFAEEKLVSVLPLPPGVVARVVLGRHVKWQIAQKEAGDGHPSLCVSPTELLQEARRGIPQGSCLSPLVGAYTCSKLQIGDWSIGALFNYVDDFLILDSSKGGLKSRITELDKAVRALPGGRFHLKRKNRGHLKKGCDFLGHHLRLNKGSLAISPTEKNLAKLLKKISGPLEAAGLYQQIGPMGPEKKAAIAETLAEMANYLRSWEAAFAGCDDLARYSTMYWNEIRDAAQALGVTLEKILAMECSVKFDPRDHFYD